MKQSKSFLMILAAIILITFFAVPNVFAADVANDTVSCVEGEAEYVFSGTFQFLTAHATDDMFTKAISAPDGDWENAVFYCYTNAEANDDINVFFRGGQTTDLTYITSVYTHTAFDDVNGGTVATWYAFKDTIGGGIAWDGWFVDPVVNLKYKVIEADGQTGNPDGANLMWWLIVPKKPEAKSFGRRLGNYEIVSTT